MSRKWRWSTSPVSLFMTNSRLDVRSSSGVWAINSSGKWKSKSFTFIFQNFLCLESFRHFHLEMLISKRCNNAPSWRALDKADLQQIRFVDVFNRRRLFADACSNRIQADRAAAETLDHAHHQFVVDVVKAERIDLQHFKRLRSHVFGNRAVAAHLRIIAHPFEQAVRDARGPTGAARNF